MKCETCARAADHAVCIDDNMETEICNACIRALRTEVSVEILD